MQPIMNILLAAINAKYIHSNLAVYCLRAYAKEKHPQYAEGISLAEYTINQQLDEILMDLYRKQPDVLCFSCYIWNIEYVEHLIKEVAKVLPQTEIWLGGPEVSYDAENVLQRLPEVKGVMRGEGEQTFAEITEYYNAKKTCLEQIKGITFRLEDKIIENEIRPIMDLSEVPFVYEEIELFRNKIIYYESSRGCPFSCSYCLSSVDKCLRFRDIEKVKRELQFFIDHKVPQVKFVDRTFNCRHGHAMTIWNYLKEHDNGVTNFHFEVAADLLNEEELELISKMREGLIQLEIGVQSTNEQTIQEIHRKMDFEKVSRCVDKVHENKNIHQHLDLIAGLPYEDYDSFHKSFNDVYALRPEQLQLGFLKVLKGSYMGEHVEEYELKYQNRPPYEVLSTKWLPYSDVIRLKGVEEMTEVYYNSGQFVNTLQLLVERVKDPFHLFEMLRDYYEEHDLMNINHTRVARYEILSAFAEKIDPEWTDKYREMLVYDLYLRENIKNRPQFAGESLLSKREEMEFYDQEDKERRYLQNYTGYDKRQMRKMTHLEKINGQVLLFDYQNRSRLTNQAKVYIVDAETS